MEITKAEKNKQATELKKTVFFYIIELFSDDWRITANFTSSHILNRTNLNKK